MVIGLTQMIDVVTLGVSSRPIYMLLLQVAHFSFTAPPSVAVDDVQTIIKPQALEPFNFQLRLAYLQSPHAAQLVLTPNS